jgi:hypothetical protein
MDVSLPHLAISILIGARLGKSGQKLEVSRFAILRFAILRCDWMRFHQMTIGEVNAVLAWLMPNFGLA